MEIFNIRTSMIGECPSPSRLKNTKLKRGSTLESKNVSTTLLSPSENEKIFNFLGPKCVTIASGIAQLLYGDLTIGEWELLGTGVICYIHDRARREVSLQLINPGYVQSQMGQWKLIISSDVNFTKNHSNLVVFNADDDKLYGLNFSQSFEAEEFFFTCRSRQIDRKQHSEQKKAEESATLPRFSTISESQAKSPKDSEAHMNTHFLKGVVKEFSSKMGDAVNIVKHTPPALERSFQQKKNKKKEKKKFNKLDIGAPTGFAHVAHCGADPFIKNAEVDETVKQVYKFLSLDINKASPKEIRMVRRQVSSIGIKRLRRSMRYSNNRKESKTQNVDMSTEMASSNPTNTMELKDARNNLCSPSRDQGRFSQISINHFNGIKTPERSHQNDKAETNISNSSAKISIKTKPPPTSRKKPEPYKMKKNSLAQNDFEKLANGMESNSDFSRGFVNMRQNEEDAINECNHNNLFQKNTSPSGQTHDSIRPPSQHGVKFRREIKSQPPPAVPPAPPPAAPPAPPPPPPPPCRSLIQSMPAAKSNVAPSSSANLDSGPISDGRQNLLEAIRNADKSKLRKVNQNETKRNDDNIMRSPVSPVSSDNLLSAIGKMIEERRKRIQDSSDDETDESSNEEWSD